MSREEHVRQAPTTWLVNCSLCSEESDVMEGDMISKGEHVHTKKDAMKYLRSDGWVLGKLAICPGCMEESDGA